jgi:hypothetical protein
MIMEIRHMPKTQVIVAKAWILATPNRLAFAMPDMT